MNADVTLSRRWLPVARILWIVMALCVIGIGAIIVPAIFSGFSAPCAARDLSRDELAFCVGFQRAHRSLGLSPMAVAAFFAGGVLVEMLAFFATAAAIFVLRGDEWHTLSFSFAAMLGALTLDTGLNSWIDYAAPALTPLGIFLVLLGNILLLDFVFRFPDGRFVPRWTRWVLVAWAAIMAGTQLFPGSVVDVYAIPQPVPVVTLASMVIAAVAVAYRYRVVADATQRQQIKWVVLAVLILSPAFMVIRAVPPDATTRSGMIFQLIFAAITYLAAVILAAAVGIAILRYRLWDIDIIIRRTLSYSALTVLLGGVYFGAVTLLQLAFTRITGSNNTLAVVISTLAIAALFRPARARIQRFIDRRFFRQKYDTGRVLADFADAVRDEIDIDGVEAALLRAVHETIQPESLALWIREGGQS